MGTKFNHLSDTERWTIESKLNEGLSYAAIGKALRRNRSTILREARRGRRPTSAASDWYLAEFGRNYYKIKRRDAGLTKRKLDPDMRSPAWQTVLFGLRQDWSPQQLCDRLKDGVLPPHVVPAGLRTLSHETIYRAIYDMPTGQQHASLVKRLRQSKSGRRKPRKRNGLRFTGIRNMTPLDQRCEAANLRLEPGHWEGDLLKGAGGRSMVGTLVDRFTRKTLLVKLRSANADHVWRAFRDRLKTLPACMLKSLTYDRGTEMARHEQFTRSTDMPVFFCDPYSPWQRGTNENTNGLLRQYMPKATDLSIFSRADLTFFERRLNGRPRRVLGRKTPDEIYQAALDKYRQASPDAQALS